MNPIDDIDTCDNLFLEEIGEPADNALRLKLVEARPGGAPGPVDAEPDAVYPGPFVHYGIFCLNHIVDVVSVTAPTVDIRIRA